MRLGNMYGPDATFAGVPAADLDDPVQLRRRPGRHRGRSLRRWYQPPVGLPLRAPGHPLH